MTSPISVGLIGFGRWVREAYCPILKELSDVKVAAVAARSETSRNLAHETFGGGLELYSNYEALLRDGRVQVVMIALPNQLHAAATAAASAADKHVFYEPPIGLTPQQTRHVLDVLSKSKRLSQVDLELRYLPVIDAVHRIINDGKVGEVRMAKVRLWCDWGYDKANLEQEFGEEGFFLWLGCWYLDLLDAIFGQAPIHANVVGGFAMNGRLMDHGWATLGYPHGRIGQFEFSMVAPQGQQISLQVAASEGEIEADIESGRYRWRSRSSAWEEGLAECSQPVFGFAGMRESIRDFFSAIRESRDIKADPEVSRRVHSATLACAQAEVEYRTKTLKGD